MYILRSSLFMTQRVRDADAEYTHTLFTRRWIFCCASCSRARAAPTNSVKARCCCSPVRDWVAARRVIILWPNWIYICSSSWFFCVYNEFTSCGGRKGFVYSVRREVQIILSWFCAGKLSFIGFCCVRWHTFSIKLFFLTWDAFYQ